MDPFLGHSHWRMSKYITWLSIRSIKTWALRLIENDFSIPHVSCPLQTLHWWKPVYKPRCTKNTQKASKWSPCIETNCQESRCEHVLRQSVFWRSIVFHLPQIVASIKEWTVTRKKMCRSVLICLTSAQGVCWLLERNSEHNDSHTKCWQRYWHRCCSSC